MTTKAVIIVPSQGKHASLFKNVAKLLDQKVYAGEGIVVKTVVRDIFGVLAVTFYKLDNSVFTWAGVRNLESILTVSHAGICDGPNLASEAGGYQPWKSTSCFGALSEEGEKFWNLVGNVLKPSGKIILVGCSVGSGTYGQSVANASKRTSYASDGLFAAADEATTLKHVKAIEKGLPIRPMKRFNPEKIPEKT